MNDDFEQKLRALAGAAGQPDPTPGWKADILANARLEAAAARRKLGPPRLLLASWALAWAAIIVLSLSTPRDAGNPSISGVAGAGRQQDALANPPSQALIALERQFNLHPDTQ